MSDYQALSNANDLSDPSNRPEWDGMWDCPSCGDHTGNMVKHDEPLKDCLDHIDGGDLREYVRREVLFLNQKIALLEAKLKDNKKLFDDISKTASECLERNR